MIQNILVKDFCLAGRISEEITLAGMKSVMHLTFSLKEIIISLPPKVKNRNLLFRFKILVTSRPVPYRINCHQTKKLTPV